MKNPIQLSDHFTYKKLIRFVIPSVIMLVFSSIYGIVDGIFVSNYAGKTAFAGLNFVMPTLQMLGALGFMLGTGGTALIAKTLGEGNKERANQIFSMLIYVTLVSGIVISVIGIIFIKPFCILLGASGELLDSACTYGRILLIGNTIFMFQMEFQSILPASEKPKLGLLFTVGAGVTNMILDFLFVGVFGLGLEGAAWATNLGQLIGGFGPLLYFILPNSSLLRVGKPFFDGKALLKICFNGCSELLGSISMSLVGMLFNIQLLKYAGENGIAAYGAIMYINFIFISCFIGYSVGSAPLVSYHYGADNTDELKNLLNKSIRLILGVSVGMVFIAYFFAGPLSTIFTGYDVELYEMTVHAFKIQAFSYLFSGVCIYGSSFFTALNNGPISALISSLRTLVFELLGVLLLPIAFGLEGIWYSMCVAEICAVSVTIVCLTINNKKYQYY